MLIIFDNNHIVQKDYDKYAYTYQNKKNSKFEIFLLLFKYLWINKVNILILN